MGFVSYSTQVENLDGANAIREGCDEFYTFTVQTSLGPANLSEFAAIGGGVRCDFRDKPKRESGTTTNVPQPTMSFPNGGTDGKIQLWMPRAQTEGTLAFLQGVFDIEIIHAATGFVTRPFTGRWEISEQVTGP